MRKKYFYVLAVFVFGTLAVLISGFAYLSGGDGTKDVSQKEEVKRKNVIFILSDDHRYDAMSFMDFNSFLKTPNMDKMATEGVNFKNAFVTTSLCSPSRASILTGMYAHQHGVVDNMSPVRGDLTYFPQYLQQLGYETAFIGKWHMGEMQGDASPRKGFDKWVSFKGQGQYFDPELNVDGKTVKVKGYITDILTDYAIDWMNKKRDKPFFLYLSHKAVHALFRPAPQDSGKFENEKVPHPASMANTPENYKDKPNWVKEQRNSWHGVDYMYYGEYDFDSFYKRYCETLLSLDRNIGRVLDYTKEKGIADNTIIFYMGDNGFMFGEHGLIDKRQMYEESIRVPLFAYSPGNLKPKTVDKMALNIDIAPTVLDIAGMKKIPEQMVGLSLYPLMKGEKTDWRKEIFYEYYWERAFPQTPSTFGVRTDKYKYIFYHGIWDQNELYDLENDPREMHNLFNKPEYKDLVDQMDKKLFDWLEETNGMEIPLRRGPDYIKNKRGPKK
jgi:arylsulfatase A-like enzyme